jgi:hypothetical protein
MSNLAAFNRLANKGNAALLDGWLVWLGTLRCSEFLAMLALRVPEVCVAVNGQAIPFGSLKKVSDNFYRDKSSGWTVIPIKFNVIHSMTNVAANHHAIYQRKVASR